MRLIDADEMKKDLRDRLKAFNDLESLAVQGAIVSLIDQQPTAYDVDAVIKAIPKESYILVDECYKDGCIQVLRIEDAIDIVKRGMSNG